MSNSRIQLALGQIQFARRYVLSLIDEMAPDDWFWQPVEGVTHVAWQIGHLAVCEYGLALRRVRGDQPLDEQLISADFRGLFGKGSTPRPDGDAYPPVEEIRATFDRVHDEALAELAAYKDEELDVPTEPAHPAFDTKLGALQFCSQHEMIHAGQIALLRRMMGKPPLR